MQKKGGGDKNTSQLYNVHAHIQIPAIHRHTQ